MGKFIEDFEEALYFSDGSIVTDGYIPKADAVARMRELDDTIDSEDLEMERVRFGFPPADVEGAEMNVPIWYTGARGRGTKLVWIHR